MVIASNGAKILNKSCRKVQQTEHHNTIDLHAAVHLRSIILFHLAGE
jgi:hypothetical protein